MCEKADKVLTSIAKELALTSLRRTSVRNITRTVKYASPIAHPMLRIAVQPRYFDAFEKATYERIHRSV